MTHNSVHDAFVMLLPMYAENETAWYGNGHNSIRIRLKDGREFIFLYNDPMNWSFQTRELFISSLMTERKGEKK